MAIQSLNEAQMQAVVAPVKPILVLAGAGSGKTRVLTNRIMHLVEGGASASSILAITFTNKAANEMKQRLMSANCSAEYMSISTIHSFCARVLRNESEALNRKRDFTIYVDDDRKNVLKKTIKNFNDDLETDHINAIGNAISQLKNSAFDIEQLNSVKEIVENNFMKDNALSDSIENCTATIEQLGEGNFIDIIKQYNDSLASNNAMDFDDLLYYVHRLFATCPTVLEKYQQRYQHILIDEFQDTNRVQFEIFQMLADKHNSLFVVGDDDQSIYGWRGADISNILNFQQHYPNALIFKLEQNYRSSKKILEVANLVIEKNSMRYPKKLWTDNSDGVRVERFCGSDDQDETRYVAKQIYSLMRNGYKPSDFAILMRMNALTRPFEQQFMAMGMPYKVFGGFKFFDRKEVKDILSYMRLVHNPFDNEAFLRCINVPYRRGIGDTTINKLHTLSRDMALPIVDVISDSRNLEGTFNKGIIAKLADFYQLYAKLVTLNNELELTEFFRYMIDETLFRQYYNELGDSERLINIDQLQQSVIDFANGMQGAKLSDFLESASLGAEENEVDDGQYITLATVHAVKGLEYRVVFVVGLNEDIFPSSRAKFNAKQQQEERRLMYVAATRARERLYLTCCRSRFLYGNRRSMTASCYFAEVDDYLRPARVISSHMLDNDAMLDRLIRSDTSSSPKQVVTAKKLDVDVKKYCVGNIVEHRNFGKGVILRIIAGKADIAFDRFGKKTMDLSVAPLNIIR